MILEAEDIRKAIAILNDGFLYDGIQHKNLLKFYGCYLNEVTFQTDFLNDENEDEDDNLALKDAPKDSKISLKNMEGHGSAKSNVTYQVGLITEEFQHSSLQSYFTYFQEKER